jgi:heptosyltransferase II
MQKILVIQTAFIGDVVLVTGLLEDLHIQYPNAVIDILLRKGNEALFHEHPFINEVLIWNKKEHKYLQLFKVIQQIREIQYDLVINVQRFAATGLITALTRIHSVVFLRSVYRMFLVRAKLYCMKLKEILD